MNAHRTLFGTVPQKDLLGFWANQTLQSKRVADFLEFDKRDVARLARVAPSSVRYDEKIPHEVFARLEEIATVCGLVADFFDGDARTTALWFKTKNPMLGDISPRDMIRFGRYERLRRFVMNALAENAADLAAASERTTGREEMPESVANDTTAVAAAT